MTTSPPLSSPMPGPVARLPARVEALERAVGLEHRVEMADQEDVAAAAAMGGDDMAGAAGLAHVDPAHLEAERLELGAHHLADRARRPSRLRVPLFRLTSRSSRATWRSASRSTAAAIARSSRERRASAGTARARSSKAEAAHIRQLRVHGSRVKPGMTNLER